MFRNSGYRVVVEPGALDSTVFEAAAAEGLAAAAQGDHVRALASLDGALGLWRGSALVEGADQPWAMGVAARLNELRLVAFEAGLAARLALGGHGEVVGLAEAALAGHPLRERLWGHLMIALYRSGRQADALRAYQRLRTTLGEELGIDPSAELVALEEAMLLRKPELDWTPLEPRADRTTIWVDGSRPRLSRTISGPGRCCWSSTTASISSTRPPV